MTDQTVEELAKEVAVELGKNLSGFAMGRVDRTPTELVVSFAWRQPTNTEISITLHENDSKESIKDQIRKQLKDLDAEPE